LVLILQLSQQCTVQYTSKKDKLLKFYIASDDEKQENIAYENKWRFWPYVDWIQQWRSQHMPVTRLLVMKQAGVYH